MIYNSNVVTVTYPLLFDSATASSNNHFNIAMYFIKYLCFHSTECFLPLILKDLTNRRLQQLRVQ
jgi:hypothetical protein